jgi:hypothetical protein
MVMENKPKAKPPARFAQKKQNEESKNETVANEDERPIVKK